MARWLELAETGSTKYSTSTRAAAVTAGGALVLATLVVLGPSLWAAAVRFAPLIEPMSATVHVLRDATRLVRDLFRVRAFARLGDYEVDGDELPPPTAT